MPDQFSNPEENAPGAENANEPVWTYRGYHLKTSEFVTSMVHLFRAEIQRANVWRQRLDTTTNWAVVATGAALSVSFSQPTVHHGVIILNIFLVTWFLFIEARRYRYYELWSYRVRLMETDFYAAMLVPPFHPSPEWAESLAENLLSPSFPISMLEAFGRRLRRNYLSIISILAVSWVGKSFLFPVSATSRAEFISRCSVGPISGEVIIAIGIIYYGILLLVAIGTIGMNEATGEVLPRYHTNDWFEPHAQSGKTRKFWTYPKHQRKQFLALIITEKTEDVANLILTDLKRGVTAMQGKGMYTGSERSILICAVTVTEIHSLKSTVVKADPHAFVIISPAQEVLGRGFSPLDRIK